MRDQIKREIDQAKAAKGVNGLTGRQKKTATDMINKWSRSKSGVIEDCQRTFNLMIRLEAADDHGFCRCVVSGYPFLYSKLDAGHFISATRQATRFDERNVHPQSKASNQFDTTNNSLIYYTIFMVETYGRDVVDELLERSKQPKKWEIDELIELRLDWLARIKKEKIRIGVN